MHLLGFLFREFLMTVFALEVSDTEVDSLVSLHITFGGEGSRTQTTVERLLSVMAPLVDYINTDKAT